MLFCIRPVVAHDNEPRLDFAEMNFALLEVFSYPYFPHESVFTIQWRTANGTTLQGSSRESPHPASLFH